MSTRKARVIANFTVKPDKTDEFIRGARELLIAPTRKEAGCIQYDLWQDDADPTRFSMVETWENDGALAAHLSQPGLQTAVGRLMPLASGAPEIRRLRSVSDD
jgi:quinol monooxygenase YgiN